MAGAYRSSRYEEERKRKRRKAILMRILVGFVLVGILTGLFFGVRAVYRRIHSWVDSVMNDPLLETTSSAAASQTRAQTTEAPDPLAPYETEIREAEWKALSYDYDAAVILLQSLPVYASSDTLKNIVQDYLKAKTTLVKQDISKVYHVYFHSLIVEPERAFGSYSQNPEHFNQSMTTLQEFEKILQQMYDNGFVLVNLHDIARKDMSGRFAQGAILLPDGKKPFVLSVDDVSYYEELKGAGFASKLLLDETGRPVCEYRDREGQIQTGDYDVIPILERFVEQHPDFSYHGAKGCIALTGYEGIFGYHTAAYYANPSDPAYKPVYASYNVEQERKEALALCNRLKELGWELACHTWGHINMDTADLSRIQADIQRWKAEVGSLTGETDILIFTSGNDIGNWRNYSSAENEKYAYLKSQGFCYFCPVDSYTIPWVQFNAEEGYLRQGRVGLSGYALAYRQEKLSVFFDAASILDPARPLPVPGY